MEIRKVLEKEALVRRACEEAKRASKTAHQLNGVRMLTVWQPIGQGIQHVGHELNIFDRAKDAGHDVIDHGKTQLDDSVVRIFRQLRELMVTILAGIGCLVVLGRLLKRFLPARR